MSQSIARPSTNDYILGLLGSPANTTSITSGWLDTGGHAEMIDIVAHAPTVGTSYTVTLSQNSTSVATGSSTVTLSAAFAAQTATGTQKHRLIQGDAANNWDGGITGRYLYLTISKSGTCQVNGAMIVHRSDEYPVE